MMPEILEAKELNLSTNKISSGEVGWRSPSNLAIIKYWGKHGYQLPWNPSLSLTLDKAFTETYIEYEVLDYESEEPGIEFYFEGKPHEAFRNKIWERIQKNIQVIPYIKNLHLTIESRNSFPHSSGIASSASAMSALSLCFCTIEQQLFSDVMEEEAFYHKASYLSRLFSGSACRSVYPRMALWGEASVYEDSSDLYAIEFHDFHKRFEHFHDDILIISPLEKKVSSSEGHALMENHPFAQQRYHTARQNLDSLFRILQEGDIWKFGDLAENEAMMLHGLMMCSNPSYVLLEPNTLEVMKEIRQIRRKYEIPVFFSLDAGPNVHILYPHECKETARQRINDSLLKYSPGKKLIRDQMGDGPVLLESSYKLKAQ